MSNAEDLLAAQLHALGIAHVREHLFALPRRFKFDFALMDYRIACEVEGGGWSGGRHNSGVGFARDLRKYEIALREGWTVYRCDPAMVANQQAIDTIRILISLRGGPYFDRASVTTPAPARRRKRAAGKHSTRSKAASKSD